MSVLVKDRHDSQIEYVYLAWETYHDIARFIMKLSPKMQSIFSTTLLELCKDMVTLTVEASEIYRKRLTEQNFIDYYNKVVEAHAVIQALDVHVNMAYRLFNENIDQTFKKQMNQDESKKARNRTEAQRKVDNNMTTASERLADEMDLLDEEIEKAKLNIEGKAWLNIS